MQCYDGAPQLIPAAAWGIMLLLPKNRLRCHNMLVTRGINRQGRQPKCTEIYSDTQIYPDILRYNILAPSLPPIGRQPELQGCSTTNHWGYLRLLEQNGRPECCTSAALSRRTVIGAASSVQPVVKCYGMLRHEAVGNTPCSVISNYWHRRWAGRSIRGVCTAVTVGSHAVAGPGYCADLVAVEMAFAI